MRLDEEAQRVEERILRHAQKIEDVPTLEKTLREGLGVFEEVLNNLSPHERQAARVLYLDKIRRVTFGFHLAIVEQNARKGFRESPSREAMQDILSHSAEEMQNIGRLYRFL